MLTNYTWRRPCRRRTGDVAGELALEGRGERKTVEPFRSRRGRDQRGSCVGRAPLTTKLAPGRAWNIAVTARSDCSHAPRRRGRAASALPFGTAKDLSLRRPSSVRRGHVVCEIGPCKAVVPMTTFRHRQMEGGHLRRGVGRRTEAARQGARSGSRLRTAPEGVAAKRGATVDACDRDRAVSRDVMPAIGRAALT